MGDNFFLLLIFLCFFSLFWNKHKYTCGHSHQPHHRCCLSSQPIKQPCKKTNTSQNYKQFIIVSYNFYSFFPKLKDKRKVESRDCGQKRNKRKIKCEVKKKKKKESEEREWEKEIVGKREECTQNKVDRNARPGSFR